MKTLPVVFAIVIASGLVGLYLNYVSSHRYAELRREYVAEMERYVELQEKHVELQESHASLLETYKATSIEVENLKRVVEANCFFKVEQAFDLGEAYSETVTKEPYVE